MPRKIESADPAAAFAVALSLHSAGDQAQFKDKEIDLSEAYGGGDEFMRWCMNVGNAFEKWCCSHVNWEIGIDDVWPYMLESHFAKHHRMMGYDIRHLNTLKESDFLQIAASLKLPVKGFWKLQDGGVSGWGDVKGAESGGDREEDHYVTDYYATRAEALEEKRSMGEQGSGMRVVRSDVPSDHDFY